MSLRPRAVAAERAVAPSLSPSQRPYGRLHHVLSVGVASCAKEREECQKALAERSRASDALAEVMRDLQGELAALQSRLQECTEASGGQLDQIAMMQKEAAKAAELLRKMQMQMLVMGKGAEGAQPEP